jgi:MarR family transcriptional regulator for hemolysin
MADVAPIRVPKDFEQEFPGARTSATEVAANLVRTAEAVLAEFQRRRREVTDLSASAFEALAILEGAGEPVAGHVIAERLLVSSPSMTSLLDTLERRGLIERERHPDDRRKVLIHLTDEARVIVNQVLPVIHRAEADALAHVSESDCEHLISTLAMVQSQLAEIAQEPPPTPKPRRKRKK